MTARFMLNHSMQWRDDDIAIEPDTRHAEIFSCRCDRQGDTRQAARSAGHWEEQRTAANSVFPDEAHTFRYIAVRCSFVLSLYRYPFREQRTVEDIDGPSRKTGQGQSKELVRNLKTLHCSCTRKPIPSETCSMTQINGTRRSTTTCGTAML